MEIRILSCMGRVYSDLLQLGEARFYLEKAYDAMHALPPERLSTALTKIYYNSPIGSWRFRSPSHQCKPVAN